MNGPLWSVSDVWLLLFLGLAIMAVFTVVAIIDAYRGRR